MNPTVELSLPLLTQEEGVANRLVLLGKALSDPIRVRMLGLMAQGRGCCGLSAAQLRSVPGEESPDGICVCEFQDLYSLGQSKVSYHLRILKEAGLIVEECRGKWTFYSLNKENAREAIGLLQEQMQL